ncbi:topoisomerase IV [Candidatus Epulonipiscium fishelsonii]|uniref:Topoisomerase IV n=1 Tax=Candidatus Epulonipiscium fishelsonii TaxID=77094 RepID=A0ACC8XF88_9FIRM|nr:topoisomerase IV [Epulopiscium sp. SCG-B11WGA-EpuloA1]ONI43267.1 topoisomerase IV [Epulopiscium sp. SCG-B05WGA-EpuloA1]
MITQNISETLETNYMPYAMSVIVSRALPEIDGFKPAHRKLLYTMYKMGLLNSAKTKSANIVGQTMKLNPHGDITIYETMVRLTVGYNALNTPFVDSKGNFGKVYSRDMAYAASRYTEAKLSKICQELFRDIEENCIKFVDNYDGKMKEPTLLPVTFPSILVNSTQGIAVGMACNICGFNLEEVCKATIAYLDNPNIEIKDYITAPDFPTGGILLYNAEELNQILSTGRGSFKLRALYERKENCIEITEIPYTTTVEAIIDKIEDLIKSGKIKEINDVRDETDLNGLKIAIDIKRGIDVELLMKKLFKMTPLQDTYTCNFNILINGSPEVVGVKRIIEEWYNFRKTCIIKKCNFNIEKMNVKYHLLEGLQMILLDLDNAIAIIRNTRDDKEVVPNLMETFSLTKAQAEYVSEIKLRHLNKQHILDVLKDLQKLTVEIKKLEIIITNEKKLKQTIKSELQNICKLNPSIRKTKVLTINDEENHIIEDYKLKFFLTNSNYLKKIPLSSLRNSGEQRLKEQDFIIQEFETTNKSELLIFTNQAKVYKIKTNEIEDCKVSQLGVYLPGLLNLDNGEMILYICSTCSYTETIVVVFEDGKISKIPLSLYQTKTNRKKLINAYYSKSKCIYINIVNENNTIKLIKANKNIKICKVNQLTTKLKRDAVGEKIFSNKKPVLKVEIN